MPIGRVERIFDSFTTLGAASALEWVMERQCVSADKDRGIENDAKYPAGTLSPRHHRKPRNDEARERAAAHRSGAFLSPVWRDSGKPRLPLTWHRGLGKPRSDLSLLSSLFFGQMVSVASARCPDGSGHARGS